VGRAGALRARSRFLAGQYETLGQRKKQIPRGNDRKKSKGDGHGKISGKGKDKSKYRGLSTALRSGRDDGDWVGAPVERTEIGWALRSR